eukprot:780-Heterococcus_DN1.PRE.1
MSSDRSGKGRARGRRNGRSNYRGSGDRAGRSAQGTAALAQGDSAGIRINYHHAGRQALGGRSQGGRMASNGRDSAGRGNSNNSQPL